MSLSWKAVMRAAKVLGMGGTTIGMAGAAVGIIGVWVTLSDLNKKEGQRKTEEWKSVVVYDIINATEKSTLRDVKAAYLQEAVKLEIDVEDRQDTKVQLALLRLLQGQAIKRNLDGSYSIKRDVDVSDYNRITEASTSRALTYIIGDTGKLNFHVFEILSNVNDSISLEVLKEKLYLQINDREFVDRTLYYVLDKMIADKRISLLSGRQVVLNRTRAPQLLPPPPPPPPQGNSPPKGKPTTVPYVLGKPTAVPVLVPAEMPSQQMTPQSRSVSGQ